MADLKNGESFTDEVYVQSKANSLGVTGLTLTCVVIDESGNRSDATVTEIGFGWYKATFTTDANGTWATEWSIASSPESYVIWVANKIYKVGGGITADIKTDTASIISLIGVVDGIVDNIYVDTQAIYTDTQNIITLLGTIDSVVDGINVIVADCQSKLANIQSTLLQGFNLDHFIPVASTITGTPSNNFFDTNLTEATNDHYNGMTILFTSGVLLGQASIITDYDGTTKEITVDPAFTEAPASTDGFCIVGIPLGALRTGSKALEAIYDLVDALGKFQRVGDTVTTDGTEQTLWLYDSPSYNLKPTKLKLDCTNMVAGDSVVVKIYYRIKSGGSLRLQDTHQFSDAQDPDLKSILLDENRFGIKVTITRLIGTDRSYDWEIHYEER